ATRTRRWDTIPEVRFHEHVTASTARCGHGGVQVMFSGLRQVRVVRGLVRKVGVHRVVKVAGILRQPILMVSTIALSGVRRDVRLVAMGSPLDRFADNAAYLFVHMSEHSSTLRP